MRLSGYCFRLLANNTIGNLYFNESKTNDGQETIIAVDFVVSFFGIELELE